MLRSPWPRAEAPWRAGRRRAASAILALALPLAAGSPAVAQTAPPPPAVVVAPVQVETVSRSDQFVGRVEAIQSVDLVSRVEGFLETLNFKEGSAVRAGDLLIGIEKAPYQAQLAAANGQVAAANAQVSSAQARLKNADVVLQRQEILLRRGTVSQATQDDAQATRDVAAAAVEQAQAMVEQAQAQVQTAQLNLSYTDIKAPITGQIGAVAITRGNLVSTQSGTIATIVQVDPIRVAFSIPETLFVGLTQQRKISADDAPARDLFTPQLTLPNGTQYGANGKISFASNEISAATGTLVIYAEFPNPDGLLLPGSFVNVTVAEVAARRAPVVLASAVLQDREGRYVFVLGADDRVAVQRIETGPQLATGFPVTKGLAGGEVVVVEGLQKVRPGIVVTPRPATVAAPTATAAAGATTSATPAPPATPPAIPAAAAAPAQAPAAAR